MTKSLFKMGESGVLGISYKLQNSAKISGFMDLKKIHIDMQDAIFSRKKCTLDLVPSKLMQQISVSTGGT